ncbi:hypothetical protein [Chitinophaga sp. sic0106]|uniref:XAC2610-related protein n=1 Tax=Chitinophaga sp. sic0106 TaxID=2854785 RepID=UPI001C43B4B3|nr:hypothetical protein [Chitinophaga sp. sic0106]MBV7531094.1 hypothetical protein [Chitinophaga sp. sic0106]
MMKKLRILVGLFLCYGVSNAQTITTVTYNYTGAVSKYPIEMQLLISSNSDSLLGEYYYTRNGRDASLTCSGIKTKQDSLFLTEKNFRVRDAKGDILVTGKFRLQGIDSLSGKWINAKTGASLQVTATLRENLQWLRPSDYDFRLRTYKAQMENAGGNKSTYTKTNLLDVYYKGKLLQSLSGFDEALYDHRAEVILEDLNFDGYFDVKVPIYFPDRTKYDGSFLYFLFNKSTRKFEINKQLNDFEYLTFDAVKKEFYRFDEGPNGFVTNYFKWRGEVAYLARTEEDEN